MSINTVRVLNLLVVVLLLSLQKWTFAVYPFVLQTFFEVIYRYSKVPKESLNRLFAQCMVCVLFGLERLRTVHFSDSIEFGINVFEHGYFAFVFCAILGVLFTSNSAKDSSWKVFLLFNTIGVFNEIYQYSAGAHWGEIPPFDTWKDLLVNVLGSTCWIVFGNTRKRRM